MSQYVKMLENIEDLEVSIIRVTKINKVLKALVKLNTIPKDEDFHFRKRSIELLGKWNKILGAEAADGDVPATGEKESKSTPTTNGVHEETGDDKKETSEKEESIADSAKPSTAEPAVDESKQPAVEDAPVPDAKEHAPLPVSIPESKVSEIVTAEQAPPTAE
jgi:hypothetical protein